MTDPHPAPTAAHAGHDLLVIAAAADRDADDAARELAQRQMFACHECAALFLDLQAIGSSLSALPRELPVARDYRISPERAAELRSRGWRRILDRFAGAPSLRPMAAALTTLGVAGLVVTLALPAAFGGLGAATGGAPAALPGSQSQEFTAGPAASAGAGVTSDSAAGGAKAGASPAAVAPGLQYAGPTSSPASVFGQQNGSDRTAAGPIDSQGREGAPAESVGSVSTQLVFAWLSVGLVLIGLGLYAVSRLGARGPAR